MDTVDVPPGVSFVFVGKEQFTMGRIYVLHAPNSRPWVCQSMTHLARAYNETNGAKLQFTCLYRILKGLSVRGYHKKCKVSRADDIDRLNDLVRDGCVVVTRDTDLWHIRLA